MADDFHDLKTISVAGGEVTLRIRRRWGVWPQEDKDGNWECYEKDEDGDASDTGTLWIQVDHFDFTGDGEPPASFTDMKQHAEAMSSREPPGHTSPIESAVFPVDHGYRWRRIYDLDEGG
ncbi:MAG: hypothetical protein VW268_11145 [Rhodospirillaceae bacterium]